MDEAMIPERRYPLIISLVDKNMNPVHHKHTIIFLPEKSSINEKGSLGIPELMFTGLSNIPSIKEFSTESMEIGSLGPKSQRAGRITIVISVKSHNI